MTLTPTDTYLVNGVDLRTAAWSITVGEGLQDGPGLRGDDVVVPGAHGSLDPHADTSQARRRFGPGSIRFSMGVLGVNPYTGLGPVALDDPSLYLARVDQLQRLFNARTLTIVHPRADGDRTATGRLAKPLQVVREPTSPLYGTFVAEVVIPGAFWSESDLVTVSGTVASGATIDLSDLACNAPITDPTIRFGPAANPMIQHGGAYLQYAGTVSSGRELVIPCGTWGPLSAGDGSAWSPSLASIVYGPGPSWFELDTTAQPLELAFTHTGGGSASCEITAYRKWLTS